MELKLDWLSFTFDDSEIVNTLNSEGTTIFSRFVNRFPGFAPLVKTSTVLTSHHYYDTGIVCDDSILIQWDESNKKGLNVSIPSHGLWRLPDLFKLKKGNNLVYQIFQKLSDNYCKLSRIDIPFDDFLYRENKFTPEFYAMKYFDGEIRTRMKSVKTVRSGHKGFTIYFGTRANGKMLRIYDKNRESKGLIDAIRYEVELHNRYARNFMQIYMSACEGGSPILFGDILTDFFEVIDLSTYPSNKSLCDLDKSWEEWITLVLRKETKISINTQRSAPSYEKLERWVTGPIWNGLITYIKAVGYDKFSSSVMHEILCLDLPPKWKKVLYEKRMLDQEVVAY